MPFDRLRANGVCVSLPMRLPLRPHPDKPGETVAAIEVELERPSMDRLRLCYSLVGEMDDIVLPAPAAPLRKDGLWRTTCFEAFVRVEGQPAYRELNFSPAGEWAAYRFRDYRDPDRCDADLLATPGIQLVALQARGLELLVDLRIDLPPGPVRLGLSAVVEEKGGRFSYWALAHPEGEPDFHSDACFALELPAARSA